MRPRRLAPSGQVERLTSTLATGSLLATAWIVFAVAMVLPAVVLITRCVVAFEPPVGGFTFSARQGLLLWRSLWLSVVATGLCLLLSLPGAYVIGRVRHLSHQPWIAALLMAQLLCPPMVYAFGWEFLLPAGVPGNARCIGVWALWAWPIPAMLIGAGWSRADPRVHEAALLVASPTGGWRESRPKAPWG